LKFVEETVELSAENAEGFIFKLVVYYVMDQASGSLKFFLVARL